jgi:hypothetical protein
VPWTTATYAATTALRRRCTAATVLGVVGAVVTLGNVHPRFAVAVRDRRSGDVPADRS